MANLLDFLRLTGDPTTDRAHAQALMALASQLTMPRAQGGQNLARAFAAGGQAIENAEDTAIKRAFIQSQTAENQSQAQARAATMAEAQRKAGEQASLRQYVGGVGGSVGLGAFKQPGTLPFLPQEFVARGGTPEQAKQLQEALNFIPDPLVHFEKTTKPGGGETVTGVSKGQRVVDLGITPRPQRPLVNVNTGDRADKSFLDALSREEAKRVSGQLSAGTSARESNAALSRIETIVSNPAGLTTGPYVGNIINQLRQLGVTAGLNVDIPRLQNDVAYEMEMRGVLADAILRSNVGRSLTDTDREELRRAFINRDIPMVALPQAIAQLRARNDALIRRADDIRSQARRHFGPDSPFVLEDESNMEPPRTSRTPSTSKTLDEIMREILRDATE